MGSSGRQLITFFAFWFCGLPGLAAAQAGEGFPSAPASMETLRVQEKAETLFQKGNFERAYFIYRNELAPIGDKYAQYMLGYMHLTGKGTSEDRVAAAAWYRLAAERGTREFVMVRDRLAASLTPEQLAAADSLFLDLRRQYGDLAILLRAVRADLETLRQRTGSRLGSGAAPLTIVDLRHGGMTESGDEFYRQIEERLRSRLDYIARATNVEIRDLGAVDIDELEVKVAKRLEALD